MGKEGCGHVRHAITAYGELEVKLHKFLTSTLDGGSGLFTSGEKSLSYPVDKSLGGLYSRPDRGEELKNSCPSRKSNSGRPVRSHSYYCFSYHGYSEKNESTYVCK
jgi:hypothetical protein